MSGALPEGGAIAAADVSKVFRGSDGRPIPALERVSLSVDPGEFVALVGPSGCGKSTLLNLVAGFERPDGGSLLLDGRSIQGPGPDRGVVFQEAALFPWLTVAQNVAFGPRNRNLSQERIKETVGALVELVGLAGFERRYPRELSGGMRQRAALAQVLANDPQILLMDEPFGALDAITRYDMQRELLRIWEQRRKTVLFITHSVDEALFLADRVVFMSPRPGRVHATIEVKLSRPRDLASNDLNALRRDALEILESTAGPEAGARVLAGS